MPKVFIPAKAFYCRPFYRDMAENLPEDDGQRLKIESTGGIYQSEFILPFDNRDDAIEYLDSKGVPVDNMMAQLVKKHEHPELGKIITYKVKRPHQITKADGDVVEFGPPEVVGLGDDGEKFDWEPDILIGNESDVTIKLNVWVGTKKKDVRWDGLAVRNLVEYVIEQDKDAY